jgi:hypothetical protein
MPSASREPGSGSGSPASGLVCTGSSRSAGMPLHPSRPCRPTESGFSWRPTWPDEVLDQRSS